MTNSEAISLIERLKAEIEWDLSLEYQTALDKAISSLKRDEIGLTDTVKQIHDGVYAEAERKTIEKCVDVFSDITFNLIKSCASCPVCDCIEELTCKENLKDYLFKKLKGKNNE